MKDWIDNLLALMESKGLNMKTLSLKAGLGDSTVSKLRKRNGDPQISTIIALADALGVSVDQVIFGTIVENRPVKQIYVVGQVAAGLWFENDAFDEQRFGEIPISEGKWSNFDQRGYKVVGDSVDAIGIADGSFVVTVPYWQARTHIQDGDTVVVERHDGHRIERTVKVVSILPGEFRLEARSNNPRWKDAYISIPRKTVSGEPDDGRIEIVGLVIGSYRAFA